MSNETTASQRTYNLLSQTRVDHAGIPMNGNVTDCFICCQPSDVFGVGKCLHPICIECCIMMRVIQKSEICPQCRFPIEMLYFVSAPDSWDSFTFPSREIRHPDSKKYGIKFTTDYIVKCYNSYMAHSCQFCAKAGSRMVFPKFVALRQHMAQVHQRNYCTICDEHLQSLSKNRVPYTATEMENHLKGTNNETSGQRGHPMCWICSERFFDDDFLNRHLKAEHFFCQLCEYMGLILSFGSTPELYSHYAMEHYACDSRDCQHMGIVFSTEEELHLHRADEHGFSLRNLAALFTGRSNQTPPGGALSTPQRESQPVPAVNVPSSSLTRNTSLRASLLNIARTRPSNSSQASNNTTVQTAILNISHPSPSESSSRPSRIARNIPSNHSAQTAISINSQRSPAAPRTRASETSSTSRTSANITSATPARNMRTPPPQQQQAVVNASPLSTSSNDHLMPPTNYASPIQRQRKQIFLFCVAVVFLIIVLIIVIKLISKKN